MTYKLLFYTDPKRLAYTVVKCDNKLEAVLKANDIVSAVTRKSIIEELDKLKRLVEAEALLPKKYKEHFKTIDTLPISFINYVLKNYNIELVEE